MTNKRTWSDEDNTKFAVMYNNNATMKELREAFPGKSQSAFNGRMISLQVHRSPDPTKVKGIRASHRAIIYGETVFLGKIVRNPRKHLNGVLKPGKNQRKLGSIVEKGPWKGMPIYSLTLEERATCPRYCQHWLTCMGNGMHGSVRFDHGPELELALDTHLSLLSKVHPHGFVVRLHVLGDFYSTEYVNKWRGWLNRYPQLHVFGYTAWNPAEYIGQEVNKLSNDMWDRFAIRWSTADPGPNRAITLWNLPVGVDSKKTSMIEEPRITLDSNTIVCPVQLGKTRDCGTCGLCWSPNARNKTIAFIAHGR